MRYSYIPQGVCSRLMTVEIENDTIINCEIAGGCNGNLKGICSLIKGMEAQDAIDRLRGIDCGGRGTSCPDQLAICIEEALESF